MKEWEWNPLVYNQSLANSIYLLVARDFAPADQRIPNLRKRLEASPAVIAQAKANLKQMMKEVFQQEGEAVAKWKRARLSSAQLSTYFVGVTEHLDLRDRARAGDSSAFNLKKYNDTVLSFGSPPVKYVRELMGL